MKTEIDDMLRLGGMTRRSFAVLSLAAGLAATTTARAAQGALVETDVMIKTPEGECQAAFIHPATGAYPAIIVWSDAFGLRPALRDIGKRLAAEGYAVLVPNPFYRITNKTPVMADVASFDVRKMRSVEYFEHTILAPGALERDAPAIISWLDAQPQVNKAKKIGILGYCMGGILAMRTAATVPDRVGAGVSLHAGGLVTDLPTSPHLLTPKIKAKFYIAVASADDVKQPEVNGKLKAAFDAAGNPAEIEVYPDTLHGWCMPDMPKLPDGRAIYNRPQAERAWAKLSAFFKTTLA